MNRREFIAGMGLAASGAVSPNAFAERLLAFNAADESARGPNLTVDRTSEGRIALEEHFVSPNCVGYWREVSAKYPSAAEFFLPKLVDFGEQRLKAMDLANIELAVLSQAGAIQIESNAAVACRNAQISNDFLATEIQKRPTRYAGFAALATQDPKAAADELERSVRDLGFKGAMINSNTLGRYLDHESFLPFWERVQALDVPIYLHPGNFYDDPLAFAGRPELSSAVWEWTVETSTHALRLVLGGTFERFPKVQLILGHMGETLPFVLERLDSRWKLFAKAYPDVKKLPSEYIKKHITVTTSGVFSQDILRFTTAALGEDRVMFSVDYPFESPEVAGRFMDTADLPRVALKKVARENAKRILRLA